MGLLNSNGYDIKYKIIVIVEDLTKGTFVEFEQTIVKNNLALTTIPREIDKRDVTLYVEDKIQQYCAENKITLNDLFIDGYEITHENENVDIYFSVEDMENFSLEPSVMAVIDTIKTKPILEGEQIDDNTVKWSWEWEGNSEYTSVVEDFSTNMVIAHTPMNVNYFIESNLKPNEVITRTVTVKKDGVEVTSTPISISVVPEIRNSVFRKWEAPKRNEDYTLQNMCVASRLAAFQSGVGDDEDCMILRPDDLKYSNKFKLINKVYGVRASSVIKYNTVKFFYRFMLKGKVNYKGYGGSFKVRARKIYIPDLKDEPTDVTYGDWVESRECCEYYFDDKAFVTEIPMYDLFEGMYPKDGSLTDYAGNRMKFEITIYDINGSMEVYSQTLGCNRIIDAVNESFTFELKGFYDTMFRVKAIPILKEREYVEVYPPKEYEPLVGAVNGDFEMSENGKKDMFAWCNDFDVPDIVFDKKYYCLIEHDKTNPSIADVQFKFDNQVDGEDYTVTPQDRVVFKCDTIIEDETEFREYITQIDRGYYAISDNRKHSYRYKLDLNNINKDRYKRLEIDVTSNVNDITILSSEAEFDFVDDKINAELYVQVRALQSAIAKWNPYIHSGYYYMNQEERFMYNRCNIDGLGLKMEQFCFKGDISVNIVFHVKGGEGKLETYDFTLSSKEDLDTSPNRFYYEDKMLWPKPSSITDNFPNYEEEYTYYTKPFVCPKEPTSILSIDWKEVTSTHTSVECYAVTYNDVYGEWREPILIEKGKPLPKDLKPSKVMMLMFKAKPSLRPKIKRREYVYSCDAAWMDFGDLDLSYNVYHKEETMVQKSPFTEGRFVSKFHDLGDTVEEEKLRKISYETTKDEDGIEIYYQESSEFSDIADRYNAYDWIRMESGREYLVDRYIRFKVILKDGARLNYLKTIIYRYEYTDMKREEYLPSFGDIFVKQEYNPDDVIKLVEYTTSMELPFDKLPHVLVENMQLLGNNIGIRQGFSTKDVIDVQFIPVGMYSEEYDITYERKNTDPVLIPSSVFVTSKEFVEDKELRENSQAGALVKPTMGRTLTLSPIPQSFSPILIQEEREGGNIVIPYRQVYFTDEEGYYSLSNVEEFESLGFKTLYLKEYNIDQTMLVVRVNGQIVDNFKIHDNIIEFDEEIERGYIVSVTYRIKNSFIAVYDYENDRVEIDLHGDDIYHLIDNVRVHYETNKDTLLKKLDHISLNPIYNPLYNGYIYISDKVNSPFKVTIIPCDNMIYANGLDTMDVLVYVEDKDCNPVSGVNVSLACAMGRLDKEISKTDINGIAHYTYRSWTGDCIDKLKASVTESVYGEAEIINRKVIIKTASAERMGE